MERHDNKRWKLPASVNTPMQATYHPELDVSLELDAKYALYYQSLIGVLHWMMELGRVDISLEVSLLSSHLALPREGHFEQVLQVFSYFKKIYNTELLVALVVAHSSSMTPVTLLLMRVSSRGGTGHQVSLGMWMGKRSCQKGCQNQGVWVS